MLNLPVDISVVDVPSLSLNTNLSLETLTEITIAMFFVH